MKYFAAVSLIALAACGAPPADTAGQVTQFTGQTVTVRGAADNTLGATPTPTAAMAAQAKQQCGGSASYLSATPSNLHQYDFAYNFLFRCG